MNKTIIILFAAYCLADCVTISPGIGYGIGVPFLTRNNYEFVSAVYYNENTGTYTLVYSGDLKLGIQPSHEPFLFANIHFSKDIFAGIGFSYSYFSLNFTGNNENILYTIQTFGVPVWVGYNKSINAVWAMYGQLGLKYGNCFSYVYRNNSGNYNNLPTSDYSRSLYFASGQAGVRTNFGKLILSNGLDFDYDLLGLTKKGTINQFNSNVMNLKYQIAIEYPIGL